MFSSVPRALRLLPPAVLLVAACALLAFSVSPPALAATHSGSGVAASESRSVDDFDAIAASGSIDLVVRQAGAASVTVSGDDNLLSFIETVVEGRPEGRTLVIRVKRGEVLRTRQSMRVTVDVVRLRTLAMAGSGGVTVERLDTPALDLSLSGSGDAVLRGLRTDSLGLRIAGSGDVQAEGAATRLRLSIAGSGDAELRALAADEVTVSLAGSGDAKVMAQRSLKVRIAGSGDVEYTGSPASVDSSIAGSGSMRKR